MPIRIKFQGAYTLVDDMDTILHWSSKNKCGRCRHGPCMCPDPDVYGPPRPTRDQRAIPSGVAAPGLGYKGMAYTDPRARAMIDADTAEFCQKMKDVLR